MNGSRFMTLFIKPNYFRQDIKKREYLLTAVRCMALMGLIAFLYYDSFWAVPALLPIGFGYFLQWEQECMEKKRVEFQKQFQERGAAGKEHRAAALCAADAWLLPVVQGSATWRAK